MNQFVLAIIFFLTSVTAAFAADREEQYWSSLKVSSSANERLTLLGELLHRYSNESEQFVTRSVRAGLEYKFENTLKYALIFENRMASSDNSDEIRYIHQLGYSWALEKISLAARGRLEQREFSNSSAFANRLRARLKGTGTGYQFSIFTPFALAEYFHTMNEVTNRPSGSTELRLQAGVNFKALGGKVGLSYIDRTTNTPSYQGNPSSESKYGIVDLAMSWSL